MNIEIKFLGVILLFEILDSYFSIILSVVWGWDNKYDSSFISEILSNEVKKLIYYQNYQLMLLLILIIKLIKIEPSFFSFKF